MRKEAGCYRVTSSRLMETGDPNGCGRQGARADDGCVFDDVVTPVVLDDSSLQAGMEKLWLAYS